MISILLAVIYLAFISLGLPDSLLGSAWPVMHADLQVSASMAGVITMIISANTIISSLQSDRLTHKFGAGKVTAISVLMTAVALLGFSASSAFWMLCLWAIPYGLGAGAVDAALNNYVALHYNSRQMSWLHCFWGVGASISPYIMGFAISKNMGWTSGYRIVSVIQMILTVIIFLSLPLWKNTSESSDTIGTEKNTSEPAESPATEKSHSGPIPLKDVIRIPGAKFLFAMFFCYCALEQSAMLWTSTYMVTVKSVPIADAARFGALFTLGLTASRFLLGIIADRLGDKNMIRLGSGCIALGLILLIIPIHGTIFAVIGLAVIGFGCGPVYPSIIHATPDNFGADRSQALIGMQMASAYVGTTFMPPIFGFISGMIGINIFPVFLILLFAIMIFMFYRMNAVLKKCKIKQ